MNTLVNPPQRILIVDDDREIVRVLRAYLEQEHFQVLIAYDGATALHCIRHDHPALVVLDLMLPDRDGWDITQEVRADQHLANLPIIMLTARVEDADKIIGLELGADDYIIKPFNPREVVARVRTVLRRFHAAATSSHDHRILVFGYLTLDLARHDLQVKGVSIELTPTEFKLLRILMENPEYVFARVDLIE